MKTLQRLNTLHAGLAFAFTLLVFLPPILILIQRIEWHQAALVLHRWWGMTFFRLSFLPIKYEWKYKPSKNEQFILCANHFSYLDIPVMATLPAPFKFIGKSSLSKIPVFGYMYRKLHITVNRSSFKSRAASMEKVREMVDRGFNIGFYPEGGIRSNHIPHMVKFQDGAFRLAVEKNIPIIPVVLPTNYIVLPDDNKFLVTRHPIKVIVLNPIHPQSIGEEEILRLKNETYEAIQSELNKHHGIT